MLFVFLAGIAPKEYIHELFFDHHDTVDLVIKKGDLVITNRHIHCSFLNFEFAPFVATAQHTLIFRVPLQHIVYFSSVYSSYYFLTHRAISLRGPPACC
jgi:hypothetical protein